MPSEPSDGIFDAPAVYGRGAGLEIPEPSFPTIPQSRNPSDNTAISKPVIPAQAGIRTPDAAGIYRK
ncbi:TPA: hypothetical protein WM280_002021 [Neisseria gonorrhoeae]|uniref:hypothetical protein n=1 Tax=Neisseria gonorrhoeae TaxID=485 RepID=UPI000AB97DCC|nr:hypothetical protein [Neisseria gonorrhoeae]